MGLAGLAAFEAFLRLGETVVQGVFPEGGRRSFGPDSGFGVYFSSRCLGASLVNPEFIRGFSPEEFVRPRRNLGRGAAHLTLLIFRGWWTALWTAPPDNNVKSRDGRPTWKSRRPGHLLRGETSMFQVRGPGWSRSGEAGDAVGFALGLAVPGFWQVLWGQAARGWALGGMTVSMLLMAAATWGLRISAVMYSGAFVLHLVSVVDAIRQRAFPGFARGVPVCSTAFLLALGLYGPVWIAGSSVAWPGEGEGAEPASYLVNRLAFRDQGPDSGDWVCYQDQEDRPVVVGRVVARSGAEVQWLVDGLLVDHRRLDWAPHLDGRTGSLRLLVPEGFLMVAPLREREADPDSDGLVLVANRSVVGRAWAQAYPVRARRLFL